MENEINITTDQIISAVMELEGEFPNFNFNDHDSYSDSRYLVIDHKELINGSVKIRFSEHINLRTSEYNLWLTSNPEFKNAKLFNVVFIDSLEDYLKAVRIVIEHIVLDFEEDEIRLNLDSDKLDYLVNWVK